MRKFSSTRGRQMGAHRAFSSCQMRGVASRGGSQTGTRRVRDGLLVQRR
jgi:hypothetical protein